MKRSLLSPLMVAFLIVAMGACAPQPARDISRTADAPKTEIAVQTDEATEAADAPKSNDATAVVGKLAPAEALKLMLLQLLVAR